jgi:hypothetical protein
LQPGIDDIKNFMTSINIKNGALNIKVIERATKQIKAEMNGNCETINYYKK